MLRVLQHTEHISRAEERRRAERILVGKLKKETT